MAKTGDSGLSAGKASRQGFTVEESRELLKRFTEGGSHEMMAKCGYGGGTENGVAIQELMGELTWKASDVDEEYCAAMDANFTPVDRDMTLYKGISLDEEAFEDARNHGTFFNHAYSSTSKREYEALGEYADRNIENEYYNSVLLRVHVKKGTPVADVMNLVGGGSMRGEEQEVTIGRNTKWEYTAIRKHPLYRNEDDEYSLWIADVTVRK